MAAARRDPAAWGVAVAYTDAHRQPQRSPRRVVEAVLDALGAGGADPVEPPALVVGAGEATLLDAPAALHLEDGTRLPPARSLPPDLPLGVHRLEDGVGGRSRLCIVSPGRCPAPPGRAGGLAVQLYAARSGQSWGIGDLADLRSLGGWARGLGAGVLLVNPLHAPFATAEQQPSPYYPSSRRFRTPLALRVEETDGFDPGDARTAELARAGRALGAERRIDRDAVWRLKREALEACFARSRSHPGLAAFRAEAGAALEAFAVHSAIVEHHGASFRRWPDELRHPGTAAVAGFAAAHRERVDLHAWLQWQVDRQLGRAAAELPLMHDLAVGSDPEGADAWVDQDALALGVRVGAPPDLLAPQGQDWGLPPWHPWRLRAQGYAPLRSVLRSVLRHAAALRIDHVLGLFRLWWIPAGCSAHEGAYVRYPVDELLAVIAIEAARAGAYVVGEDLGTVGRGVRSTLRRHRVLSYRVVYFEDTPPSRLPRGVMAAVTTHDLPTVVGLWEGSDLAAQRQLGIAPTEAEVEALRARVRTASGLGNGASAARVCEALHAALAASPAALVTATLDDLALVAERPNMPGTVDEWPNWRLALPMPIEELMGDPRAVRVATMVARR